MAGLLQVRFRPEPTPFLECVRIVGLSEGEEGVRIVVDGCIVKDEPGASNVTGSGQGATAAQKSLHIKRGTRWCRWWFLDKRLILRCPTSFRLHGSPEHLDSVLRILIHHSSGW